MIISPIWITDKAIASLNRKKKGEDGGPRDNIIEAVGHYQKAVCACLGTGLSECDGVSLSPHALWSTAVKAVKFLK